MSETIRLDAVLVARGLITGRDKAKKAVSDGFVTVNGRVVTKPSTAVSESDEVCCSIVQRFVGRGGEKLFKVLSDMSVEVSGRVCADIGASTGGFTDCLLQHGAQTVYAVDVGHNQLAASLCADTRVVNMEGTDIRNRDAVRQRIPDHTVDVCSVDVSFISLTQIFDSILPLMTENGTIICLIKPQFEAGREALSKRGVVRREKDHIRVLQLLLSFWQQRSHNVTYLSWSPVRGGEGNIEYIAVLSANASAVSVDVPTLVRQAFSALQDET